MKGKRGLPAASLTVISVLIAVALGVYVGAFAIYLAVRLERSAARLDPQSEATPQFFAALTEFAQTLNIAVVRSYLPLATDRVGRLRQAAELRQLILAAPNRATPSLYSGIPDAMRTRLARADQRAASLQIALLEYVALVELDRLAEAESRRASAGAIAADLQRLVAAAERAAVNDLVARQAGLRRVARFATQAVLWWLLGGGVLLVVGLRLLRRRILSPLRELEDALERVAGGDLRARIHVKRLDELGRLQDHFNRTSEVLQRRAHEQGRFVAAGELLAGIAHEVNNPLMAIAATAEVRLAEGSAPSEQQEDYATILKQARRAGRLVSALLRFVRPREEQPSHVDVNGAMREALDLVSYRFPHHQVQVELSLAADVAWAHMQASRLEQVRGNHVSNAGDALKTADPPRRIRIASSSGAHRVRITVEDNGPGIAPEMERRLFQPFATSKGDQGTGLGLYMSRELIRSAGGDLRAERLPDRGVRFVVELPEASGPAPTDTQASVSSAAGVPRIAGTRVLLVEDEEAIRVPVGRYLTRRGAEVSQASDGKQALVYIGLHPVDVIVTDARMPIMDGPTLYGILAHRRPELAARMLFLSGDISQLGDLAGLPGMVDRIIVKPVDLPVLEAAIADVIASERAAS